MHTAQLPLAPSEDLKAKIMGLDLTMPLAKVMDPKEGYGWDAATARRNERDYKRFLYLAAISTAIIVPTTSIDKMWHAHILDTRKYADDCDRIFGGFFHHFPYFGIRGEDDTKNLSSAFAETKRIWAETFGETALGGDADCSAGYCEKCGNCGPEDCAETKPGEIHVNAATLGGDETSPPPAATIRTGTEPFRDSFAKKLPPTLAVF